MATTGSTELAVILVMFPAIYLGMCAVASSQDICSTSGEMKYSMTPEKSPLENGK